MMCWQSLALHIWQYYNLGQWHMPGHGAMPGTKKMPDLELILKVVMPSDPTFHFRNYVYI